MLLYFFGVLFLKYLDKHVLLTKDWNDVIDVQPSFYEGVDRDEQA